MHERGTKNRVFRPICRLIAEMVQDRAIVTMERQETRMRSIDGVISNDLE